MVYNLHVQLEWICKRRKRKTRTHFQHNKSTLKELGKISNISGREGGIGQARAADLVKRGSSSRQHNIAALLSDPYFACLVNFFLPRQPKAAL